MADGTQEGGSSGELTRRRLIWTIVFGWLAAVGLATVRFFFPRDLFEPKTTFRIGYPAEYGIGVDTRFQQGQRIWVVRDAGGIFVILAKCTHLGCTPDWKESENKFKCPCHGSGFTREGINYEGPAPRPLDRLHVEIDSGGQILVNKAIAYPNPKTWSGAEAYLVV